MTRSRRLLDALTEVALVGLHIVLAVSFVRLFVDSFYLGDLILAVLIVHATVSAVRHLGGGVFLSALGTAIATAIATTHVFYPETASLLPTRNTWEVFRTDMSNAWELFQSVQAPTQPVRPFLVVAALALMLTVFLADWAAFRLRSPIEAVAPATVVFVFGALFAGDQHRLATSAAFVAAIALYALLHRTATVHAQANWLGGSASRGTQTILQTGAMVGAVAVAAGLLLTPSVLDGESEGLIEFNELAPGGSSRVGISPLVSVQSQIVDLADVEVFTVETDRPDYWRLTSLDSFDGTVWSSSGRFNDAEGVLPSSLPAGTVATNNEQTFKIRNLDGFWLPAAYEPSSVPDDGGSDPIYDPISGTLVVSEDVGSPVGITYVVESRIPQRDLAAISGANASIDPDIAAQYLDLPDDFSPEIDQLAQDIVAGATTPYQQALALQNFFRDGTFTYNLEIERGHGVDSLEEFLFDVRSGYCEQYSSSFAAMARAVGLPSRVAVGFTPGVRDGDVYRVRGEHAHAWPEVWLADIGWLRFEPTPGRGAPGDEIYTNQQAQQAQTGAPDEAVPLGEEEAAPPPTVPPRPTAPAPTTPTSIPDAAPDNGAGGDADVAGAAGSDSGISWPPLVVTIPLVVLLAIGGFVALVAAARRRLDRAALDDADASASVRNAWRRALASLRHRGVRLLPHETPLEFAARCRGSVKNGSALATLADVTTEATYSSTPPSLDRASAAVTATSELEQEIWQHATARQRVARWVDPRPVLDAVRR